MATKFVPEPANSGGRMRSAALAKRIARVAQLTLCAYDDGTSDAEALRAEGIDVRAVPWPPPRLDVARSVARSRSITIGRFATAALASTVRAALDEGADLLVVSYTALGYLLEIPGAHRTALDLHNIESSLLASYQRDRGRIASVMLAPEVTAVRALERRALRSADTVAVVSPEDARRAAALGRSDVLVCPNGWEPRGELTPRDEPVAAFIGLLGWRPNVDAARWLVDEVWPAVRARSPRAILLLVGRDPAPAVRALAGPDVTVTGTVPDVEPYLARARVALAPLRSGGGSRLKILEALGAGRPVVATSIGAEGLTDLEGLGLIIADDPRAFADAVADLLESPERAASLGHTGHEAVVARYGWDRTLAPMLELLS